MERKDIMYDYHIGSPMFLSRAIGKLENFDSTGDVGSLFYAALELRFCIEARLTEYIGAELKALNKDTDDYREYVATTLLSKLQTLNSRAEETLHLKSTNQSSGHATYLTYTPVTRELAQMHGKLGEFLHYKFFRSNPAWFYKVPFADAKGKSLSDVRVFLDEVKEELRLATSGHLLSHPRFNFIVEQVASSKPEN